MKKEQINLWTKETYEYQFVSDWLPNIMTYIHEEDDTMRPAFIVVPGGGYSIVSPTEGEIVAEKFYRMGYNAFVVTYTINLAGNPLKFQPMKDLSRAVQMVRAKAAEWHVIENQVAVCGFSAGAHLVGSLAVHWEDIKLAEQEMYSTNQNKDLNNRPDAVVLCYPVITSGEYAHRGSFDQLLGKDATKEELEYMSLEKQVNKKTPPVFLWQTISDGAVPVQNSYLMAQACLEAGVPFAHHVFPRGQHGLSLANELWASGNYGGGYTVEQWADFIMDSVQNGRELPLSLNITGRNLTRGELIAKYMEGIQNRKPQPIPEVQIWPQLVQEFLYVCYHNVHSNQ